MGWAARKGTYNGASGAQLFRLPSRKRPFMRTSKIKVLIVDDHDVMRQGLKALLQAQEDIEVVGVANNGQEAFEENKGAEARCSSAGYCDAGDARDRLGGEIGRKLARR